MTKPGALSSRLAKWALFLSPYGIHFVPQKFIKGQEIANFLAKHHIPKNSKLCEDISNEAAKIHAISNEQAWQYFFDGAPRRTVA